MKEDLDKSETWGNIPPRPAPGFETDLIRQVESFVAELPAGVARLRTGRVPGHPEWPEPYFEVIPSNPKAAHFAGVAVSSDLYLTIGHAEREFIGFARGGNIVRGASWQKELRSIWQAVIAGGFIQHHYLDSRGKVIGWSFRIAVEGKDVVFRNGRRTERLFGRERVESVAYESYL